MDKILITDQVASIFFLFAILHTFIVKKFQQIAMKAPKDSLKENFFHLLGEIEIVFGLWAAFYFIFLFLYQGHSFAIDFIESKKFNEPLFVFVIMSLCSTRPILELANEAIEKLANIIPIKKKALVFYFITLTIGPLLGSLITESAAMTVTALLLLEHFYSKKVSLRFKYATLGLLFVNVSIGGTLTHFAAPPVLMVAKQWGWDSLYMLKNFGWRGTLACLISSLWVIYRFRNELLVLEWNKVEKKYLNIPFWIKFVHLIFLILIILSSHYSVLFMSLFLFFLGFVTATKKYQSPLKLRESLLVGFFLGGLMILGDSQRWWIEKVLFLFDPISLYFGVSLLTSITDNAALTYLGSQVVGLSDPAKYALVAGALTGGGLTVIANAPNPAGYGILNRSFGPQGLSSWKLFISSLVPTLIAMGFFIIGLL